MKKSKLISLLALATAAAGLASCGDNAKCKIGVLLPVEHAALRTCANGFEEALNEAGLVEGSDYSFDIKNAGGSDADLTAMAKDLVSTKDMTFGLGTGASKQLMSASIEKGLTNPVFFSAVTDPVAANLVSSVENPNGFVCGTSDAQPIADQLLLHKQNRGKGAALRTGFAAATGDVLIPQDADLELDPKDIINVIQPIINNQCDAVVGSRFLNTKMKGYRRNRLANIVLTKFSNFCTKQKITDVNCCYIAFKKKDLKSLDLKENDFAINPELIGKLSNIGAKIGEVPIQYFPRTNAEGKKVKFSDGFKAIKAIWKYRYKKHFNN